MVKYLVEKHGCDLNYKDRCGVTPLDLATTWNNKAVISYVKERFDMDTEPSIFVSFINEYVPPFTMNFCSILEPPHREHYIKG